MVAQNCIGVKSNDCLFSFDKYGGIYGNILFGLFIQLRLELAAVPLLLKALGCVDFGK